MNNFKQVENLITDWKAAGLSASEIICNLAEATLGWPYVWGAYGQKCTPSHRKAYAARGVCPTGESEQILKKCPVCSGKKSTCNGCKYYPGGPVLDFDCRGFTRWVLSRAGISLLGAGATSQWNTASNWAQKGLITELPAGQVCCLFMQNGKKMSHTGLHVGGGSIIHCSGEVKRGRTTDRGWTHYGIPKGLEGGTPVQEIKPTLRRGSAGEAVKQLQSMLMDRGYDLSPYGADGQFGKKTEAAVRAFQWDNGLAVDGIVGMNTWSVFYKNADSAVLYYTVTVPHLTEAQAVSLLQTYPGATKSEEG